MSEMKKKMVLVLAMTMALSVPVFATTASAAAYVNHKKPAVSDNVKIKTGTYKGTIMEVSDDQITVMTTSKKATYDVIVFNIGKSTKLNNCKLTDLKVGAEVNVKHSLAMTRSIPPQSAAVSITLLKKAPVVTKYSGNISDVVRGKDGKTITVDSIEKGNGFEKIVFTVNKDTKLDGCTMDDLATGAIVELTYGPVMTKSLPPMTVALSVKLAKAAELSRIFNYDGSISEIYVDKDYKMVTVATADKTASFTEIRFVVSKDTKFINGATEDLKVGTKVKMTYGPVMTMSLPPQTSALSVEIIK